MNGVPTLRLPGAHPWPSLAPGCRAQSRQKETSSCPKIVGPKSHGFNDVSSQYGQLAQWKHSHFGEKPISGEGEKATWKLDPSRRSQLGWDIAPTSSLERRKARSCRCWMDQVPQGTLEAKRGGSPKPWVARLEWSNFGWFGDPPFYETPSLSCFNTWNHITLYLKKYINALCICTYNMTRTCTI